MAPSDPSTALRNAPGRVPAPIRALLAALFLAAVGIVGSEVIATALFGHLPALPILTRTVISVLLVQGVVFGGLSAAYLRYRGRPTDYVGVSVPDLEGWLHAAAGYVLALVAAFTMVFVVVFLLGLTPAQNRAAQLGQQDPRVLLALLVLSVLVIGPGEELLFRGVIQSRLRETFSMPIGIGLATAIFAAAHVTSLVGPTSGIALTVTLLFVPALVFAVIYERTGTVVVPAAAHGAYNATLFGLAYVSVALG